MEPPGPIKLYFCQYNTRVGHFISRHTENTPKIDWPDIFEPKAGHFDAKSGIVTRLKLKLTKKAKLHK